MNIIKIKNGSNIPNNFTGIAVYQDGTKAWYKEGILHREDGPAVEYANGTKEWWFEGKWHREDGPAFERPDGYKEWCLEGECYLSISLKYYVILDFYKGQYGLMWYKLLDKDEIIEYPDMQGLITK